MSELMGYELELYADLLEYRDAIIRKDGGDYYLHVDLAQGGGSGDPYFELFENGRREWAEKGD